MPKKPKISTPFRLSENDRQILDKLVDVFSVDNRTDVITKLIRDAAKSNNIKVKIID